MHADVDLFLHEYFILPADGNDASIGIENGNGLYGSEFDFDTRNVTSRRDIEFHESSNEGVCLTWRYFGVGAIDGLVCGIEENDSL